MNNGTNSDFVDVDAAIDAFMADWLADPDIAPDPDPTLPADSDSADSDSD